MSETPQAGSNVNGWPSALYGRIVRCNLMMATEALPRDPSPSLAAQSLSAAELRTRRRELGLTQAELAERLGVRGNTVARWERGELHPTHPAQVARRLARLERAKAQPSIVRARTQPKPASLAATPRGNLRAPLSSFIGRQEELAEVCRLLGATRLLCLSGPGGIGKTRLAIEAARVFARDNVEEVCVVDLAGVADGDLVARSVASALGVVERVDQHPMETVAQALRDQRLLLMLDNCEHVLAACAELADGLLRSCTGLRVLTTTREPLGIGGETVWRVPPMEVPGASQPLVVETLAEVDAVRLFVDRAQAALPGFVLSQQNASAVADLCRRLDGIPLALELAAAQVPVLSVEQLLHRLDDAVRLLTTGSRVAPPRQQTLGATLEWSYGLLSASEQLLFRRLSVFVGGWVLEAAEAICCGDDIEREMVLPLLARLVNKSLALGDVRSDGPERYRLLEPLRQFGMERLRDTGQTASLRKRHLSYFRAMAEHAADQARGHDQAQWFQWFELEIDNLRAALDWAIASRDASEGLRLGAALEGFWRQGGRVTEGRPRLEALLALPNASSDPNAQVAGLNALSNLSRRFASTLAAARSYAEQGLAIARKMPNAPGLQCDALKQLGWAMLLMGDWHAAELQFRAALEIAGGLGPWDVAIVLCSLGGAHVMQGNTTDGRRLLEQGIAGLRALGDSRNLAAYLCLLAEADIRDGQCAEARRHAREAFENTHSAPGWGRLFDLFIRLAATERQPERVIRLAAALSTMSPRIGFSALTSPDLVEAAKRALGEAKSARLWTEGQAMTRDEIVAFALNAESADPRAQKLRAGSPTGLTARETQVLRMLVDSKSNREIGRALTLSVRTVERHIANVYAKIGARGRVDATAYALRQGLA